MVAPRLDATTAPEPTTRINNRIAAVDNETHTHGIILVINDIIVQM